MKKKVAQWIVLGALASSCQSDSSSHSETSNQTTSPHCHNEQCKGKESLEKMYDQQISDATEATDAVDATSATAAPSSPDAPKKEEKKEASQPSTEENQENNSSSAEPVSEVKAVSLLSSEEEASILSSVLGIVSEVSNPPSDLTAELLELEMEAATLEMEQELIAP